MSVSAMSATLYSDNIPKQACSHCQIPPTLFMIMQSSAPRHASSGTGTRQRQMSSPTPPSAKPGPAVSTSSPQITPRSDGLNGSGGGSNTPGVLHRGRRGVSVQPQRACSRSRARGEKRLRRSSSNTRLPASLICRSGSPDHQPSVLSPPAGTTSPGTAVLPAASPVLLPESVVEKPNPLMSVLRSLLSPRHAQPRTLQLSTPVTVPGAVLSGTNIAVQPIAPATTITAHALPGPTRALQEIGHATAVPEVEASEAHMTHCHAADTSLMLLNGQSPRTEHNPFRSQAAPCQSVPTANAVPSDILQTGQPSYPHPQPIPTTTMARSGTVDFRMSSAVHTLDPSSIASTSGSQYPDAAHRAKHQQEYVHGGEGHYNIFSTLTAAHVDQVHEGADASNAADPDPTENAHPQPEKAAFAASQAAAAPSPEAAAASAAALPAAAVSVQAASLKPARSRPSHTGIDLGRSIMPPAASATMRAAQNCVGKRTNQFTSPLMHGLQKLQHSSAMHLRSQARAVSFVPPFHPPQVVPARPIATPGIVLSPSRVLELERALTGTGIQSTRTQQAPLPTAAGRAATSEVAQSQGGGDMPCSAPATLGAATAQFVPSWRSTAPQPSTDSYRGVLPVQTAEQLQNITQEMVRGRRWLEFNSQLFCAAATSAAGGPLLSHDAAVASGPLIHMLQLAAADASRRMHVEPASKLVSHMLPPSLHRYMAAAEQTAASPVEGADSRLAAVSLEVAPVASRVVRPVALLQHPVLLVPPVSLPQQPVSLHATSELRSKRRSQPRESWGSDTGQDPNTCMVREPVLRQGVGSVDDNLNSQPSHQPPPQLQQHRITSQPVVLQDSALNQQPSVRLSAADPSDSSQPVSNRPLAQAPMPAEPASTSSSTPRPLPPGVYERVPMEIRSSLQHRASLNAASQVGLLQATSALIDKIICCRHDLVENLPHNHCNKHCTRKNEVFDGKDFMCGDKYFEALAPLHPRCICPLPLFA